MPHRRAFTTVDLHLIWATHRRRPLIRPELELPLYALFKAKTAQLGGHYVIGNGTTDHVHLLIGLPTSLTVARLVGQLKGSSAYMINHQLRPAVHFRWQHGYAAFAVPANRRDIVIRYISRQKESARA